MTAIGWSSRFARGARAPGETFRPSPSPPTATSTVRTGRCRPGSRLISGNLSIPGSCVEPWPASFAARRLPAVRAELAARRGEGLRDGLGQTPSELAVELVEIVERAQPLGRIHVERARQAIRRHREPLQVEAPRSRNRTDRCFRGARGPADALHHPLEDAHVLAVSRPEERAVRPTPERAAPWGSSKWGAIDGHWGGGAVNGDWGCAAGPLAGCQGRPCQSTSPAGGSGVRPSHHGSPDGVSATLVKIVFERTIAVPLGFVLGLVFGATPKKPRSGLMARSWPWASTHIQAMSSPSVHARQPGSDETTMARFVLPDALGMAAAR